MDKEYRDKIYAQLEEIVMGRKQMSAQDFADFEMKLIELRHFEENVLVDLTSKFNMLRANIQGTGIAAKHASEATQEWSDMKRQDNLVKRLKAQISTAHSQTYVRK